MSLSNIFFNMMAISSLVFLQACSTLDKVKDDALHFGDDLTFSLLSDILGGYEIDDDLRQAREKGLALTDAARKADLDRIYKKVISSTKATKYSDNRIKIHSNGALIGSTDRSELDFFIRAAVETLNEGYDGFVVVHLDYYKPGSQILPLTPSLNLSSQRWIGTYESFLQHRNEQNMFESKSGVNRKVRQGVILLVNEKDFPNRDRFDAWQIYSNLIEARYAL